MPMAQDLGVCLVIGGLSVYAPALTVLVVSLDKIQYFTHCLLLVVRWQQYLAASPVSTTQGSWAVRSFPPSVSE